MTWRWTGMGIAAPMVLLLVAWAAPAWPADVVTGARLNLVEGDVQFLPRGGTAWEAAGAQHPIAAGDQVAGSGRVEMLFPGGTAVRLGPGSRARIVSVMAGLAEVELQAGRANVTAGTADLTLGATGATVTAYPTSKVRVDLEAGGAVAALRDGLAWVGRVALAGGQAVWLHGGSTTAAEFPAADDFDRWCDDRDRASAAASSSPATPPMGTGPSVPGSSEPRPRPQR